MSRPAAPLARSRQLPGPLLRSEAYSHPAADLRLHETHISWVVLAGSYAYKVKKPIDLGFLDFSTVERRAEVCSDEVRLNRRLCPDVYLGVAWLVERDGELFVDSTGRKVEPIVKMRRLPSEGMLPSLLGKGAVDASLVRRIGHRLARFHVTASTGDGIDEHGRPSAIRANWDENFSQTASFGERVLPAKVRQAIVDYVERFLDQQATLLERRVATGRIREGHGDLHAASICIEGDRLHLFDCIEFSARIRCADVAAEVAFLSMDLDRYGRPELASEFVDAYVDESRDTELRSLLDFYTCYRAYVRGKVIGLRLAEPDLTQGETAELMDQARVYFDLAYRYARGGQ